MEVQETEQLHFRAFVITKGSQTFFSYPTKYSYT